MSNSDGGFSRMLRLWRGLTGGGEAALLPNSSLSGPMPWVIAIMVALTIIALAASLTLRNAVLSAQNELEGGITVQIVDGRQDIRQEQSAAAVEHLQELSGVVSVRQVPQEELDRLIEPWLGMEVGTGVDSAIPVPALIDVQLSGTANPDRIAAIRNALSEVAPAARVDAQSSWLQPVYAALESLQWLAIALVILLTLALTAAVLMASRNALGTNRDTIEIVHLLGGTDSQIAGVFQRSIGVNAAGGGLIGLALAVVVVLFLGDRFGELGAGMVNQGALDWQDWVLLALVPLVATLLSMATARITVMHALNKML